MLAPFSPFITEEVWSHLPGADGSVHTASWPAPDIDDPEAEAAGRLVATVASEVRAWKSDQGFALNEELDRVELYLDGVERHPDTYDLAETINAPVLLRDGSPDVELEPVGVDIDHSVLGPEFRERAEAVAAALEAADPAELAAQAVSTGSVEIDVDGDTVTVDAAAFDVIEDHRGEGGEEVAVIETADATVIVYP